MASFGESLRRERELRGVSLREIADHTKISARFLQAIEEDRLDVLPGGVFRSAFVKQYARYLGLDPERTVAEFVHSHAESGRGAEAPRRISEAAHPGSVLLVAVLAVAAVLSVLKAGQGRETRLDPDRRPVPAALPPSDRAGARPGSAAALATVAAPANALVLTLSARQACWVEARVDGQVVLNRVLDEGQSEKIEATGEIVLSVGNAGGLTFTVNDRQGVPLGRDGEVRRNIVITRQSLPSFVEEPAQPPLRASSSS
jgi:cytoskeletal protein RodZ